MNERFLGLVDIFGRMVYNNTPPLYVEWNVSHERTRNSNGSDLRLYVCQITCTALL